MMQEGYIYTPEGRVWYGKAGSGAGLPLLTLHGGPGVGHDYLEPLEVLGDKRTVVFYDQLGCGKSDVPDDGRVWTAGHFAGEIDAVRNALGLERVHLFGHSWGGFLALEYMARKPEGVVSLTLASTAASAAAFAEAARGLLPGLPEDVRETIERCEAEGTTDSPEYEAASFAFIGKHVYRGEQPWPDCLQRSLANMSASPVYGTMWGPSEFNVAGTLKDWDRTPVLAQIRIPTLVTCGRHDEATPALAEGLAGQIAGAKLAIFEDSAHLAHIEEQERYTGVVREFLREAEARA
jgi:proline-specific peptidase